jgi:hydrogenase maturation protease
MGDGRALVICYGNRLRGDDGIAWHVGERLAADPRLDDADVVCAHQLTPELAVEVSRARVVVLVDAAVDGTPGTVQRRPVTAPEEDALDRAGWSHGLTPATLAGLASMLFGRVPPMEVVTVAGASFDVSEHLSAPVAAAVAETAETVAVAVGTIGRGPGADQP